MDGGVRAVDQSTIPALAHKSAWCGTWLSTGVKEGVLYSKLSHTLLFTFFYESCSSCN
jgi:hypothetical protein